VINTDQPATEVQRDPSTNHFQSIHTEMHRRFEAKSYSLIRVKQYAAVLAFLETWDAAMEGGEGTDENA